MDFSISEEQAMLQDSVARFIDNDYDFERRQKIAASPEGFSREIWATFAELGLTAVPFAEEDGGLAGGGVETMLIMEQLGRGLVVEPWLASIVMAGGVLRRLANDEQKAQWLAPLIDGSRIGALAFAEPQARYRVDDMLLQAQRDGDAWRLDGRKTLVLAGGIADTIVVAARTDGERHARDGVTLFVLDADTAGLTRRSYPTVDGMQAAELRFDGVRVAASQQLGDAGGGLATLEAAVDDATLAVASEALGIMERLNHKTLEYTKSRVQFGVPIASFQALQHRMVDMFIAYEQTRSLLLWAVMTQDSGTADERRAAVSAVKYQVGTAGRLIGQEAVQLHGGMGVTWELDVAHYFKRLTVIDTLFGNADFHLDRYSRLDR